MNNASILFPAGNLLSELFPPVSAVSYQTSGPSRLAVDVEDRNDKWLIKADLPGIAKEDVSVSLNDRTLTITASYDSGKPDKQETQDEHASYLIAERNYGKIKRSFRVAAGVVSESINASLDNGVLTVSIAKPDEVKSGGKIEVQ